jgi:diguanylate cyclase (GGDEF)-like protein
MADTDARTGLMNSRAFDTAVESRVLARTRGARDAVLMFDLDHFKAFNDRYGHPAGDEALRAFAGILRETLREGDIVARYGGEEFVAYLPGLDRVAAAEVAERIRERTAASILAIGPGQTARITVSVGVAIGPEDGPDRASLLRIADQRLYEAKAAGRDRVAGGRTVAVAGRRPRAVAAEAGSGASSATRSARRSSTRGR